MNLIVANDLHKTFRNGTAPALAGVSLLVPRGEWVAVTGPSGCGKTTLLHLLGGLDTPDSGEVLIDGESVSSRSESARAKLRRQHVGYVFQQYNLVPELDAIGNVELPLLLCGMRRRTARRRAAKLLDQLGIGECAQRAPSSLSGGQQQRVAIARALSARPSVILADEPTGALDSASAELVVGALEVAHDEGQTIVMVTHDAVVAAAADRRVRMFDGQIAWRLDVASTRAELTTDSVR